MRSIYLVLFLFLFFCPIHHPIGAGEPNINFRNWTTEEGLSQNSVYAIFQDRKGFIWIGTADGLNRFDGFDFITYRQNPDNPNSLSGSYLRSITEDREENLWLVLDDNGVTRYNQKDGQFTIYNTALSGTDTVKLLQPAVAGLAPDGVIFIQSIYGISRYYKHDQMLHFYGLDSSLSGIYLNGMCFLEDGRILVGSNKGILFFSQETGLFTPVPGFSAAVSKLWADSLGVWCGTSTAGLYRFFPDQNRMVKIGAVQATSILAITSDHTGQLWLGTQGDGLFQYDQRSGKIIRQYLHSPGKTGISSNIVSSLFVDRSGLLWIGTDAGGLSMFSTKPPQFRTYNNKQMGLDSLPGNFIRAVYSPDRERVFLGILDIGLIEKNLLTGKVRHLMRFIDQSGKSYNNIVSLTPLSERYLLVGTEKKLYLYDTQLNKERELAELMASLVYVESPASILVAALNGTFQFQIEPSLAVVKIDTISMLATTSILIDGRSVIWYGTKGLGLFSYDRQTGHSEKFCFDPTESASLSNDYITTLFLQNTASGQILWVGTRNGLNQMLPTRDGFRRIGTSDGLPNAYIYAIEEDLQHRLWISTNLGLSRFNPAAGIFRNFTTRDGLQSNEFNGRCSFCREDQAFFFGGVNGLNMFYPDSIIDHPETQDIVLTGFNVFDRPYKLSGDPAFLNRLRLDYRQNTVSFQFTALEYVNTGAVQFVYQLQGVDSGWVQAGGKREARYTNLNPGEYIFLVRHANQNNSPGLTIHLELIPPFWATTWFRITSILTLPFLVFGIIRYIEIQKLQKQIQRLKQEKIIEKERSRISRDMHDDIGASLSRIALLSQIIETGQMEAEKVMGKIHDISEMSRNLIDNISEIIWAINPDHDQASSLLGFVRNYIAKSLESADLNYHISFPGYIPELPLSSEFRRNVFLIIKESLANVLKHAQAGEVKVDVQFSEKLFTVTISDNGRGFSPGEARSSGNGLRNIKKRIAELDGQWQVDSAPGHGTTIHFSVPLRTQDS